MAIKKDRGIRDQVKKRIRRNHSWTESEL